MLNLTFFFQEVKELFSFKAQDFYNSVIEPQRLFNLTSSTIHKDNFDNTSSPLGNNTPIGNVESILLSKMFLNLL